MHIRIFDTTLRDGEQAPGFSMGIEDKVRLAKQLERLGVDVIEAGFPIASPDDFKAVEAISKTLEKPEICGLARAVEKDIKAAHEALKHAKKPRIHTFLALSDIHLEHKLKMTREEAKKRSVEAVKLARSLCDRVDFSPEDASRSEPEFMYEVLEAVIEAGADTINIPDTVGYGTPEEFGELIKNIKKNVRNIDQVHLAVHCHNDLGLATANSLAAVKNGATQIECTINGIGERAGNASLEEVVMALKVRNDVYKYETSINTKEIQRTSKLLTQITGVTVQPNKAIVGANAFAHEAGIHQHGMLSARETYEIMSPEDVGIDKSKLVLGKHSGRHALKDRLAQLGITPNDEDLVQIFERFKKLADKKKEVYDEDLETIVHQEYTEAPDTVTLKDIKVVCGNTQEPSSEISIIVDGVEKSASSIGTGPVDATYKAIDSILGLECTLLEFSLKAVTEGIDAQAGVSVRIKDNETDRIYTGWSADTDIVVASAVAYLSAMNKIYRRKQLAEKH